MSLKKLLKRSSLDIYFPVIYSYNYVTVRPGRVAQSVGHLTRKSGVLELEHNVCLPKRKIEIYNLVCKIAKCKIVASHFSNIDPSTDYTLKTIYNKFCLQFFTA